MREFTKKIFIYIFIFSTFFVPRNIYNHTFSNEIILILSLINSLVVIITFEIDLNSILFICFGFLFSLLFSFSYLINNPTIFLMKDIGEILKPLIYFLIITSSYIISKYISEEKLYKAIIKLSIMSIFFSTLVFFPQLNPIQDIYKGRTSSDEFVTQFFRFSGFIGYPAVFGYWLVFSYLVFLLKKIDERKTIKNFFLISIVILSIILTGSKGAILIFIIVNLILLILLFPYINKINLILFSIITSISIFSILTLNQHIEIASIKYLIQNINDPLSSSFGHRYQEIILAIESIKNGKFFGNGPDNLNLMSRGPVETVYFYYIYKFGIFGILFYSLLILLVLKILLSSKKMTLSWFFSLWAFIILTIGSLNEAITEEYKSFYLFFFLLGFFLRNEHKKITFKESQG